jgi:hypothetical protein
LEAWNPKIWESLKSEAGIWSGEIQIPASGFSDSQIPEFQNSKLHSITRCIYIHPRAYRSKHDHIARMQFMSFLLAMQYQV